MSSIDAVSTVRRPADSPIETAMLNRASLHRNDTLEMMDLDTPAEYILERPQLTPPPNLPMSEYRLLAATESARKLGNDILETLSVRLSAVKNKIKDISTENIKKLREAAEKANASDFWSILKKIATCLLSAMSIVFGVALIGSGGAAIIGGSMIASGVLSLANFALSEAGAWEWVSKQLARDNEDWQRKLNMILPAAFGIMAGGIGLVGSVHSLATGAIQFAEKAVYIAQTALALFDGATTLGKGIADAQLTWAQADVSLVQSQLTAERTNFDSVMRAIETSMSDFRAIKGKVKKTFQLIAKSNVQLVRQA